MPPVVAVERDRLVGEVGEAGPHEPRGERGLARLRVGREDAGQPVALDAAGVARDRVVRVDCSLVEPLHEAATNCVGAGRQQHVLAARGSSSRRRRRRPVGSTRYSVAGDAGSANPSSNQAQVTPEVVVLDRQREVAARARGSRGSRTLCARSLDDAIPGAPEVAAGSEATRDEVRALREHDGAKVGETRRWSRAAPAPRRPGG